MRDDLLYGADEIAMFLFGSADARTRKRVYDMRRRSNFPFHKLGSVLCARKSTVLAYIAAQEFAAFEGDNIMRKA